jgi:acetylornithine aminotransferase
MPDVCTLAKALGNGVPIGACLASGVAASLWSAGKHGSTFGGNPLACSAALAVLETVEQENLIAKVSAKGQKITQQLTKQLQNNPHVIDIRHYGLMIGIELAQPCGELVKLALAKGLLINVTADKVIRLLPPLIIKKKQIRHLTHTLADLIQEYTQNL